MENQNVNMLDGKSECEIRDIVEECDNTISTELLVSNVRLLRVLPFKLINMFLVVS